MSTLHTFAQDWLVRLAWTSLQAALLVGAIWALGRALPRLSAATRSLLWWLLGVQLLLGMALPTPVALPLLTPSTPPAAAAPAPVEVAYAAPSEHRIAGFNASGTSASTDALAAPAVIHRASGDTPVASHWPWQNMLLALWLSGVLLQAAFAVRQWRQARAVLRASQALHDPALLAACAEQAKALGLRRCPELRVCAAIRSPQVSGLWRPVVLLPAEQALSSEETALALAHELVHLRRGDLWMGWVPAVAQRLFFFHPLVNWAMREYALHREAACDAQVMQQHGAAPQLYGRLLLRLGVAHPLHAGLAGASPTFLNLKRRLTMLQHSAQDSTSRGRSWLLVALLAAIGVLPYRVTEARPDPTNAAPANAASTAAPAVSPSPAVSPAAAPAAVPAARANQAATVTRTVTTTRTSSTPPVPPVPPAPPAPMAPVAPAAPPPPPPPRSPEAGNFSNAHHVHVDVTNNTDYGFVLLDGDSVTVNGADVDLQNAERLHKPGEPLVIFRHAGQSYVIHDTALVARARAAYAPVTALATQQGRLGGEQGRLGGEQGGIGAREGALGMREASLATREARIVTRAATGGGEGEAAGERAGIAAERAEIQRERDELARQQEQLAKQQEALGKQQAVLGKQQEQASAKAQDEMKRLLQEAIAKGTAQPLSST